MALIRIRSKKKSSSSNKHRKGVLSVALPWARRFGIRLAVLVFIAWLGAWIYFTDAHKMAGDWVQNQIVMASASMGFRIENIYMEGRELADADVILALMNVQKGDPLFSVSPKDAQDLLTQIEWVRSAHVERRLPDTVFIRLEERVPIAFLQKDKKLHLIDRAGEIINDRDNMARFKDLPIVIGAGSSEHAPAILSIIYNHPIVSKRLESLTFISSRRWDLTLSKKLVVKLPETGVEKALALLDDIQARDEILDKDIRHIDLREEGRIIVRTKPGSVQEYKATTRPGNNI